MTQYSRDRSVPCGGKAPGVFGLFRRGRGAGGSSARAKRHGRCGDRRDLTAAVESLEARSMMAGDLPEVVQVLWNGRAVEAVRDEFVLRMPQLNVASSRSQLAYACATPATPAGWTVSELGIGFFSLKAPGATVAQVQGWAASQGVKTLEPNGVTRTVGNSATFASAIGNVSNDPMLTDQWGLTQINAPQAWYRTTGSNDVVVAVLDDGIDYNHEDLQANMWQRPANIPAGVIGRYGYDFANKDDNPSPDGSNHGTAVAGVIGAVGNNGRGISGVAQTVKMMAMKVGNGITDGASVSLVTTQATVAAMAKLVQLKNQYGVNIVAANASYSRRGLPDGAEAQAVASLGSAGITFVAAAGNDKISIDNNPLRPNQSVFPAGYDNDNVITVAATKQDSILAGYSNYGTTRVEIAAPGGESSGGVADIKTTFANNQYGFMSGTSMSAGFVTGAVALLKSVAPAATVAEVRKALLDGALKLNLLASSVQQGNRLNVESALLQLVPVAPPQTPVDPTPSFPTTQATAVLEGNSGQTAVELKVRLDRPPRPGKSCAVWYETVSGTAIAGSDFVAQQGFVSFSGNETEKTIRLQVVGDRTIEPNENFTVRIDLMKSKGVNLPAGGGTAPSPTATVMIMDDDGTTNPNPPVPPQPNPLLPKVVVGLKMQPDGNGGMVPVPIREGGVATFVVSLDKTSSVPVSVKYRTNAPMMVAAGTATPGVDYRATSGTITFLPGETQKEFTVDIFRDQLVEGAEQFQVVLSEPVNAELGAAGGGGGGGGGAGAVSGPSIVATILDVPSLPGPAAGFQIAVTFPDNTLSPAQKAAFQLAATKWQQVIVGDLPNVVDPVTGVIVDDIWIEASGPAIDGAYGILGQAGPTQFRSGAKGLPWQGVMQFDFADLAMMERDGTLNSVILHEMGHVLGFGSLWQRFGLVTGAGTVNPQYVGPNAGREYRGTFGYATGYVPVENTGGQGTYGAHWRESVLVNELMTGYAESVGVAMPLSKITAGAMQDLGYVVDYTKADPYARPTPAMVAAVPQRPVTTGNLVAPRANLVSSAPRNSGASTVMVPAVPTSQPENRDTRGALAARAALSALVGVAESGPGVRVRLPSTGVAGRLFAALGRS